MSEQNKMPFDLEKFKAGMKAKWGNQLIKYTYTATNGFICFEFEAGDPSYLALEHLINAVTMVSRHQSLIDSYDPYDTWQIYCPSTHKKGQWGECRQTPLWHEDCEYRIHPHNDLIKAWKKGEKIQMSLSINEPFYDDHNPNWNEDNIYRIKPEPVIHCLAYDAKRFDHEQTTAVRARIVKKSDAVANGLHIIQEWEV